MTAFLARLDGHLINALSRLSGGYLSALIALAEWTITVEEKASALRSKLERTPAGRHRAAAGSRTWGQDVTARSDYEWAMAIKRMAARMEGAHAWR